MNVVYTQILLERVNSKEMFVSYPTIGLDPIFL